MVGLFAPILCTMPKTLPSGLNTRRNTDQPRFQWRNTVPMDDRIDVTPVATIPRRNGLSEAVKKRAITISCVPTPSAADRICPIGRQTPCQTTAQLEPRKASSLRRFYWSPQVGMVLDCSSPKGLGLAWTEGSAFVWRLSALHVFEFASAQEEYK